MSPGLRKIALTAHIMSSIGWFGAVIAFLALALAGLFSRNLELGRAAYRVMGLITWTAIVPLALVGLLTGIGSSLGTRWGLFRHYWVLLKLIITVIATIVLLVHTRPIALLADAAANPVGMGANLYGTQVQMVVASGGALGVLLILTVLSIYKPRGMTWYGQKQDEQRKEAVSIDKHADGESDYSSSSRLG